MLSVKFSGTWNAEERLRALQERTWAVRWRAPAFCKRVLSNALKSGRPAYAESRPLQFNLAWLERWSGNFEASSRYADEAFGTMDKTSDPEGWTEMLVCKAISVYSVGDTTLADELLTEGFEVLGAELDNRAGIELLSVLANFCANSGSFEEANRQLQQAAAIAEHAGLLFEPARILQVTARVALKSGEPETALKHARKCLDQSLATRNAVILPYAYETYSAAAVSTGQFQEARDAATLGLEAAGRNADIRVTCQLYHVIGRSFYREHRTQEARDAFRFGLKTAEAINYPLWTRHFLSKLSEIHEELGEYREALSYLRAFTDIQTRLYTLERERQSYALRAQLEYRLAQVAANYERKMRAKTQTLNRELRDANKSLRELNAQIEFNALHDSLTGTGNRRKMARFFDSLASGGETGKPVAALLIDLDRFKELNDRHGHDVGDTVLTETAKRMSELIGMDELLIRVGGDEFLILSTVRAIAEELERLAQAVIDRVNEPILVHGVPHSVGASIGVTAVPSGPDLERDLLLSADEALYQAKRTGRNRFFLHQLAKRDECRGAGQGADC